MKRRFWLENSMTDLAIMAAKSPVTAEFRALLKEADFHAMVQGIDNRPFVKALKQPVMAATDPWSDVEYQSLYITDTDRDNRIVLQEPTVKDPMVGVMVLKAARLRGESGMVYCGTPEQLAQFAAKLEEYEMRGEDLSEKEFLECLVDAAEADGLKVIHQKLSEEHGGEDESDE